MRCLSLLAVCLVVSACADHVARGPRPEPPKPLAAAPPVVSAPKPEEAAPPSAETPPPGASDTTGAKDFDVALYRKLAARPGNFMVCTPSIDYALGIAYLGARGKTAQEMSTVLAFDADPSAAAAALKKGVASWKASAGGAELAIANRLWLDTSFPLKPDYTKTVNDAWAAGVEPVDFATKTEAARSAINGWVAKQTKDKIPTLFERGVLTPLTRLVITNAIYFKGTWASAFDKTNTRDEPFKVDGTGSQNVPTMHLTAELQAATIDGGKVLELGYAKSDLAMDIFLPDDANGLAKLEASLSSENIARWTKKLGSQRVAVSLPRFTFSSGGSVKAPLQELGIEEAFTDRADFSGATPAPSGLKVSDVIHKTFVSVDESGTEGAAATGVVMAPRGMAPRALIFDADHPFVFAIRDTKTGKILFLGRVTNPKG